MKQRIMHTQEELTIPAGKVMLRGFLSIPPKSRVIVVFSHGSDSSRYSPRNQAVAHYLNEHAIGTLLFDLLTPEENQNNKSIRFDIDLLAKRLMDVTIWLEQLPVAKNCRIAYFGASTGAASALQAAAGLKEIIAVVSRGGRPDMASTYLPDVEAPVLLIVGSLDTQVLSLNKKAYTQLRCIRKMEVIEGATHLFEESGSMERVAKLACNWFEKFSTAVSVLP